MVTAVGNRIKETTTTSGTSDPITLLGAQSGFNTWASQISVGDWTYYCIIDGIDFEIGYGQLTNSTTITRDTILDSSNGGSALDLSISTKTVFCEVPASRLMFLDTNGNIADPSGFRGTIFLDLLATLKAETGMDDGESAFIIAGASDDDHLGGLYEYRSGSVATADDFEVVTPSIMGGRFHRILSKENKEILIPQSAEPSSPAQGWIAYSDGTVSTNGFGDSGKGLYTYNGTLWTAVGTTTKTGAGSPVGTTTPDVIGQVYLDTSANVAWVSTGLTNSDWDIISNQQWTATVDAGSQKLDNLARVDFNSLSAEPTDAEEGMFAYSNGTGSTNGFGDEGEGFYWFNGTVWALVGSGVAAGSVALTAMEDRNAYTVIGRKSATLGSPEEINESEFKTMMNLEIGTDVQAYQAGLSAWGSKTAPSGTPVGHTDTQTLSNKTINQPRLLLENSATPTPTLEGEIWWDNDGHVLVIGNGVDQTIIGTVAASGGLLAANNLSDLASASTARTNLGLLALATKATVGNAEIDALAVDTAEIAANAVTLAKLATIADDRLLGNVSGGAAVPAALTAAQVKTLLSIANTDVSGLSVFAPSTYTEILGADIEDNVVLGGTEGITIPIGTTGQRPAGSNGITRYNSTTNRFEGYEGAWKNFVQEGATTDSLDWGSVAELLPSSYDYAVDSIILYDDDADDVVKTPLSKIAMAVNAQVDNYTIVMSDGNSLITVDNAAAKTVTIPTNATTAFEIGTTIHIMQKGAGDVDVDGAVGVTVTTSAGNTCYEQNSVLAITKIATDEWLVYGDVR
jgi:hypothetical protein